MHCLHDTHLHLDLYNKDMSEIVKEIEINRIFTIAVTNLPVLYEKLKTIINSQYIHLALGFHPELIHEYKRYSENMWANINDTRFIGEVGLDFKNSPQNIRNSQANFFAELIERCNRLGNKILSVHSKGGENELLSFLPDNFNSKIILHWYSGSLKNIDAALEKGCFFSINYQMLKSNNGKKVINRIPRDRLLLESDGPFVKIENKSFRPADLHKTLSKLSFVVNINRNELLETLSINLNRLLKEQ